MAISRIKTDGIQDDAVTQPKIKDNITLDGTEFVKVPAGTTAQRPSSAAGGQLRFNTDLGTLEQFNTTTNSLTLPLDSLLADMFLFTSIS